MSSEATTDKIGQPGSQQIQRRILLIDDEKLILWLLQENLGQIPNCLVETATSGEEALDLCTNLWFDLVITDYKLPDLDGLTLAAIIRHMQPQVKIVMLTGYANDVRLEGAASLPVQRILSKPVSPVYLRELVATLLVQQTEYSSLKVAHD